MKKRVVRKQESVTLDQLKHLLKHAILPSFEIDVTTKDWVMPNRVKFTNWLDTTFKYPPVTKKVKCQECSEDGACPILKPDAITLFPHQQRIKDYMQFTSPYRGLLLYHGVGVGKSCSSIAAAEILMNHMDVIVMLPASLKGNYVNEVKKCGRRFYGTKQHWVFVPISVFENEISQIARLSSVSSAILKNNGGIWVPENKDGVSPNFHEMSDAQKKQIIEQIDHIISTKYRFIHYNGLKLANIVEMNKDGNPFDNKCIIVDEIHNLISRIVNGGKIGSALYKLLMSAKNCKLILLSGTPIINYPYEISYLMNLIMGPKKQYILQCTKTSNFDTKEILTIGYSNKYIDMIEADPNNKRISLTLLPSGFVYTSRKSSLVSRDSASINVEDTEIIDKIIAEFKKNGFNVSKKVAIKEFKILPEDDKEFNKTFVNMEKGSIVNPRVFARRILGSVSYYSTYSPELYPQWEVVDVLLPMTDHQFQVYEKSRLEERKKEKNSKFGAKKTDNIFKDSGQVYRFYSRANCNFVFPEDIKRPYPNMKNIMNEIDDDEDGLRVLNKVIKEADDKKMEIKEYDKALNACLEKLASNPKSYLHINNIGKYSPKFEEIYKKINAQNGTSMIYSQFRRIEGLGIIALMLQANGYAEFKIKRVGGEWEVDITEEDSTKPKYIVFTGNNEETQVLLKVFNSDIDNLPPKIKTWIKGTKNTHGELIKVLMITQSGAEGISLRNVRQVHIVEPYWNYVRIDQVIGRAVRTCSHIDLPLAERNVKVFIYNLKFSKEQLEKSFTIRTQDDSMTSDEYIYNLAKRKNKIISMFLDVLKQSSIDCALNNTPGVKCFSFPVNLKESEYTYDLDIKDEILDEQMSRALETVEWKGEVLVTKKGNFLLRKETNEVYDYDVYLTNQKLVKIGILKIVDDKKTIMRE